MKISTSYIVTCILLGGFICCEAQVTIVTPPENTTVCRGSNGTVICGYQSDIPVNVSWIINGASPVLDTDLSSYRYQLNDVDDTLNYSLTLLNVDYNTTFQCIVESTENTTMSTLGRVTVIEPFVRITSSISGCGYVFVSWADDNNETCQDDYYNVMSRYSIHTVFTQGNVTAGIRSCCTESYNFSIIPNDTLVDIAIYTYIPPHDNVPISNVARTSVRSLVFETPTPTMVTAKVDSNNDTVVITVSWQAAMINTSCSDNATVSAYNITVTDLDSSASVTTPANMSSFEISEFPGNFTIVADTNYTITVSAITDQGRIYPSDPVVISIATTGGTDSSAGAIAGGVTAVIIAAIITLATCIIY